MSKSESSTCEHLANNVHRGKHSEVYKRRAPQASSQHPLFLLSSQTTTLGITFGLFPLPRCSKPRSVLRHCTLWRYRLSRHYPATPEGHRPSLVATPHRPLSSTSPLIVSDLHHHEQHSAPISRYPLRIALYLSIHAHSQAALHPHCHRRLLIRRAPFPTVEPHPPPQHLLPRRGPYCPPHHLSPSTYRHYRCLHR